MIEPTRAAFLLIDMQNGFIDPTSALCVAGAADTVPACAHALDFARSIGISIFHIRRIYSADGANVEPVRYRQWRDGGRPLSPASEDESSLNWPDMLTPADGDRMMVKPRFSAFFDTQLDDVLSREGINTVVLAGTTTPNWRALDLLRRTFPELQRRRLGRRHLLAATPEVQRANIEDMAYIGAHIMSVAEFLRAGTLSSAGHRRRHGARDRSGVLRNRPGGRSSRPNDGRSRTLQRPHIGSPSPHARFPHVGADGHDRAARNAHFDRCKRTSRNARSEGDLDHHDCENRHA